jgi:hypothetical protein
MGDLAPFACGGGDSSDIAPRAVLCCVAAGAPQKRREIRGRGGCISARSLYLSCLRARAVHAPRRWLSLAPGVTTLGEACRPRSDLGGSPSGHTLGLPGRGDRVGRGVALTRLL